MYLCVCMINMDGGVSCLVCVCVEGGGVVIRTRFNCR